MNNIEIFLTTAALAAQANNAGISTEYKIFIVYE